MTQSNPDANKETEQTRKVPDWLFYGPHSMGIRMAIADEEAKNITDGSGEIASMTCEGIVGPAQEGEQPLYIVRCHIACQSGHGYSYDFDSSFYAVCLVTREGCEMPSIREATSDEVTKMETVTVDNDGEEEGEEDEEVTETESFDQEKAIADYTHATQNLSVSSTETFTLSAESSKAIERLETEAARNGLKFEFNEGVKVWTLVPLKVAGFDEEIEPGEDEFDQGREDEDAERDPS